MIGIQTGWIAGPYVLGGAPRMEIHPRHQYLLGLEEALYSTASTEIGCHNQHRAYTHSLSSKFVSPRPFYLECTAIESPVLYF